MSKTEKAFDLIANAKNIIMGLLFVLSLLGATYGSFKPESDARETYDLLAPDIDMILEEADANQDFLRNLEARIIRLEAEKEVLQGLLIGYLTSQNQYQAPQKGQVKRLAKPLPAPTSLPIPSDNLAEEPRMQRQAPAPIKRRPRAKPYWKK